MVRNCKTNNQRKLGKRIISADFFLADLLSSENESLKDNLFVILQKNKYKYGKEINEDEELIEKTATFTDKQKAYKEFWAVYERPPKKEFWDYIIERRDLLVPQDIRERKGSFFTPQIWVEKSQQYLADVLGETWQDEYVIWDCCAGTGNLLNGLTNYDNVWASTLDKADVDVMKDRVNNGWNMPEDHIFQFDFLNDDFSKCPEDLQKILNDDEKRKKLVIYINPPYAEAGDTKQLSGTGKNKEDVSTDNKTYEKYKDLIGKASNEVYAQFFIRIYNEIPNCILGEFSKLKVLQAPNFENFRDVFQPKLEKLFIVPANTFDNVKGKFPIGFFIWNCNKKENFSRINADIYSSKNEFQGIKTIYCSKKTDKSIGVWLSQFKDKENACIGMMNSGRTDFQNQKYNYIENELTVERTHALLHYFTKKTIITGCVFLAVRQCIEATWLNDRDQFLYPNDNWKTDKEFQSNCLIYTLFHGQNRISSEQGENHWIPFTREQVGCKKSFKSNFMSKFIKDFLEGKIKLLDKEEISLDFSNSSNSIKEEYSFISEKTALSEEAQSVYDSGLELWKYYHSQPNANPNASFYDIRKYFQGETNGRMNNTSEDTVYNELITDLRNKMKALAKRIEPKVYEYGFLK